MDLLIETLAKKGMTVLLEYSGAGRPRQLTCKRGHPLRGEGADVQLLKNGTVKNCRICNRDRGRARYHQVKWDNALEPLKRLTW